MGIIGWLKVLYTVFTAVMKIIDWLDGNDPTYTVADKEADAKELGETLLAMHRSKGKDVAPFNRFHERLRGRMARRMLALRSEGPGTFA